MKPIIGVTALVDVERESQWMLPAYLEAVEQQGCVPIVLPTADDSETLSRYLDICDGLLFTGGHDVDPAVYAQPFKADNVHPNAARDSMETKLIRMAIEADKPVLAICRGLQLINAVLGGTLWQDLPSQRPGRVNHRMKPPYDAPAHINTIVAGTPLHDLLGKDEFTVNSRHHQAIDSIAPCLKPMAISEDGLIEAFYMPGRRYLWGVQWHPEHSFKTNADSRALFHSFAQACIHE